MKVWWILGILAILLLLMGVREGFEGERSSTTMATTSGTTPEPNCAPTDYLLTPDKTKCQSPSLDKVCPDDFPYEVNGRCWETPDKRGQSMEKQCPYETSEKPGGLCIEEELTARCPEGFTFEIVSGQGRCKPTPPPATTPPVTTTPPATTPPATTTQGGVTPATVRKNNILGPTFTSYGASLDGDGVDSYKTTQYPELLGGGDPASRRRQQTGAGGFGFGSLTGVDLQGSLPTADGLGATEQSKFFPFSRQPGDMELIPDPYRVSQQFSSASYSFKTEPTPFLTDFSAFFR